MDLTIWDALLGSISWGIRLMFWPIGLVIKNREFFGTILPYLVLGSIALIVGTAAIGPIGCVLRGVFLTTRSIFRFFGAFFAAFRPSHKDEPQGAEEAAVDGSKDPTDPYQVLGVSRDISESGLNARYRQLLLTNHPDKVAQLDPAIQALATQRSRRIIEAYQKLRIHDLPVSG